MQSNDQTLKKHIAKSARKWFSWSVFCWVWFIL